MLSNLESKMPIQTGDPEDTISIDVRRKFVLQDSIQEGKKKKMKDVTCKWLKVTFVGECGIDSGGPRQSFICPKCCTIPSFLWR